MPAARDRSGWWPGKKGRRWCWQRNAAYFEKDQRGRRLPLLDGIKISFFDNKATEFLLFQQGELDFTNDIDPSFKDEVISKKGTLKKTMGGERS